MMIGENSEGFLFGGVIFNFFISILNELIFLFFIFLSVGIVNIFVLFGGG